MNFTLSVTHLVNLITSVCLYGDIEKNNACMIYHTNCVIRQEHNKLILKDTPNCVKLKIKWEKENELIQNRIRSR